MMFSPDTYTFACPVKTNSGKKALEHLPVELDALDARKPLLITDKGAAGKGLTNCVIDAFKGSGVTIGVFDGVPEAPDLTLIRDLFSIYRDKGFDAIMAMGGGPVTNTAKALNIAVSGEPAHLQSCAGADRIPRRLKPLVYLPTLSGTGYETSRFAFLGDRMYASSFLMPNLVVIDPRITVPEDAGTTASAALIALAHSVEAYGCPGKNPLTDSYAYAAIQFVMENLTRVIRRPQNENGRLALANASCMAGCAFSNLSAGMVHILGEALGDACGVSPGLCMGILLPRVLSRYALMPDYHIAELLLPLAGFDAYAATEKTMRAQRVIDTLYDLQEDLFNVGGGAIPRTLNDLNLSEDTMIDVARKAAGDGSKGFDMDGCLAILERAVKGR